MTSQFELTTTDRHFAGFVCRKAGSTSTWLELAAALASNAVGESHVCLHLARLAGTIIQVSGKDVQMPEFGHLKGCLEEMPVVGPPGAFRPLVLDESGRLYLYRYWKYERDLAGAIQEKASVVCDVDEAVLRSGLDRLFQRSGTEEVDWQKVAAAAAVRSRFCVISGGPGTGKTSTVVKILALLLEQRGGKAMRIAVAAPTGKSAARLGESVRSMKKELNCAEEVKNLIPEDVSTIHRLLGLKGGSIRFRYSETNLLPHDAVIVDEASMVSLPLMAKLAMALRRDAHLILLGDRDQLASVEAGAALGDICGGNRRGQYSTEFRDFVARVALEQIADDPSSGPGLLLADSLVVLRRNYRFKSDSAIAALAAAVNSGEARQAVAVLEQGASREVIRRSVPKPGRLKKCLAQAVIEGYGEYLAAESPAEALRLFDTFRILCALRQGPYGVAGVNAAIEAILAETGLIDPDRRWYRGRPVMVTVNDYNLRLFNGDVGIVFPDENEKGKTNVFFPDSKEGVRRISPARLPEHETVFAMTIHKSQGSEFDQVIMLLPPHDSEVLTRELIYTGLTRARKKAEIWTDEEVFAGAVSKSIERSSGLADALWSRAGNGS
ncbi:MAG TPA: exodeoxyribonuclease V subunit alpha [Acidobacteriota bacterium]|nr:exodeoxyribonuclease V subunit alpha [Acidobacteriota bacterium]